MEHKSQMEKYLSMDIMKEPQVFIKFDDDNVISVNQDVLNELRQIDFPLNVVSIIGPYRSGKSYLATRLLDNAKGFVLGSTVQAMTKGMWIWCKPHPVQKDQILVVIDSEGLGDPKKTNTTECDSKLFVLTLLLCSTLIYNVKGTLDNDALEKISFATTTSSSIQVKEGNDSNTAELACYFPAFILAIRDFTLDLEIDGEEVDEKRYLEYCLEFNKSEKHDIARNWIRNSFVTRECFVLEIPGSRKIMKQLEDISDSELNEEFVRQRDQLITHVHTHCTPMTLSNLQPVNGNVFSVLVDNYVKALKDGKVPCISSAYMMASTIENERVFKETLEQYEMSLREGFTSPVSDSDTLLALHKTAFNKAKDIFKNGMFTYSKDSSDEYEQKFKDTVAEVFAHIQKEDEQKSEKCCRDKIDQLSKSMHERIAASHYTKGGGYIMYMQDRRIIEEQYDACQDLGVAKRRKMIQFSEEMQQHSQLVRQADEQLNESQKAMEKEQEEKQNTLKEKEESEKQLVIKQKEAEQMKEDFEKHSAELDSKHKQQLEEMKADMENKFARSMEEQRKAAQEAHDKQINELKDQNKALENKLSWLAYAKSGADVFGSCASAIGSINSLIGSGKSSITPEQKTTKTAARKPPSNPTQTTKTPRTVFTITNVRK